MRLITIATLLFVAAPVFAQVAALVQVNTLQPAQSGGCFVGTAGSDATLFLRLMPGSTGCDTGDFNPNLCLTRLETPGDQPDGSIVSFGDSSLLRPSVTGDGSVALFSRNIDLCLMSTGTAQQDICYNLPPTWYVHSATVNPQGDRIVMVPRDLNNINVPANAIHFFAAGPFPQLQLLNTWQFFNPVIYPESVDPMTGGDWILFDASTSPFVGFGVWGLYLVNKTSGALHTLVAPIAGYELRNPSFAQTSDDVIVFDAYETATGINTVLSANIVSGEVREIAQTAVFGVPGFTGDDGAVVFNREDAGTMSTISLRRVAVGADRITPLGAESGVVTNGGYGVVYRRGTFDPSAVACQAAIPGIVPAGTLQINAGGGRSAGSVTLDLSWDASCSGGATDYTVHEGAIGNWYSHSSEVCSTTGTQLSGYTPQPGDRYFLIVPVTLDAEGSYGAASDGTPRPVSSTTCLGQQIADVCP